MLPCSPIRPIAGQDMKIYFLLLQLLWMESESLVQAIGTVAALSPIAYSAHIQRFKYCVHRVVIKSWLKLDEEFGWDRHQVLGVRRRDKHPFRPYIK